jgi:ABC-2 type transport system ATP-binding protein
VGALYKPEGDGPHPAMLMTHGWGADHNAAYVERLTAMYASNGYVVLAYDSRGFGESGGEVGVDGPKEVQDVSHLITWLATTEKADVRTENSNPRNPRIGMDSLSYAGGIQLNTAAVDDRLNAIVPQWAWYDLVYSLVPNGVIKSGWGALLYAVGNTGVRGVTSGDGVPDKHDVRYGLDDGVHRAFLGSTATNDFSQAVKSFYKVRSPVTKLDQLADNDTPTLFISGWNDSLFVPNEPLWNFHGLREGGVTARLLLFQGGHTFGETPTGEVQEFIDQQALEFIEIHVRGSDRGKERERKGRGVDIPIVTYYDVQEDSGVSSFKTARDVPPPMLTSLQLTLRQQPRARRLSSQTASRPPRPARSRQPTKTTPKG